MTISAPDLQRILKTFVVGEPQIFTKVHAHGAGGLGPKTLAPLKTGNGAPTGTPDAFFYLNTGAASASTMLYAASPSLAFTQWVALDLAVLGL